MCCTHQAACTFIPVHQGSLIRGDGLKDPLGAIHDQVFRRFTVQKLEKLHKKNINFIIERGQHGLFMETWVFLSYSKADFNIATMHRIDRRRCEAPLLARRWVVALGLVEQMASDFVVLGRKVGG